MMEQARTQKRASRIGTARRSGAAAKVISETLAAAAQEQAVSDEERHIRELLAEAPLFYCRGIKAPAADLTDLTPEDQREIAFAACLVWHAAHEAELVKHVASDLADAITSPSSHHGQDVDVERVSIGVAQGVEFISKLLDEATRRLY